MCGSGRAVPEDARPQLPPEVLDLLSLAGRVRVSRGQGGDTRVMDVAVAPLPEGLFVLVPEGSPMLSALDEDPRCVLMAEQDAPPWRMVARGRGIPGRRVTADPLRAQLMYWLPEGARPESLVVVRFAAEHLEYTRAAQRFQGPVPHGACPEPLSAWTALAVERQAPWIAAMLASCFVAGIFLEPGTAARMVLVAATVLPAFVLRVGLELWNHGAVAARWRDAAEPESAAWAVQRGWLGAAELRRGGVRAMAAGAALLPVLLATRPALALLAVLTSGFAVVAPFHAVRHLFRGADAAARAPRVAPDPSRGDSLS